LSRSQLNPRQHSPPHPQITRRRKKIRTNNRTLLTVGEMVVILTSPQARTDKMIRPVKASPMVRAAAMAVRIKMTRKIKMRDQATEEMAAWVTEMTMGTVGEIAVRVMEIKTGMAEGMAREMAVVRTMTAVTIRMMTTRTRIAHEGPILLEFRRLYICHR
jgi:hypothetical protein